MLPHIVEKVAVFGLWFLRKKIAKKYQKQQFVSILRRILRLKPAMLANFWDHVSIVSFFQSFFVVLMTGLSAVQKYLSLKISNIFFLQKWGVNIVRK